MQAPTDSPERNKLPFSPAMMMTLAAVQVEGGLALLAILIAYFASIPLLEMVTFEPLAVLFAVLGTLPVILLCWLIYKVPLKSVEFTRRFMRSIYLDFVRHCSVLQLFLIALMSGIGEELLFRGVLQTTVVHWFGGETRGLIFGILITSVLFGLAHPINKLYVFLCIVIGVYLGLTFVWSGNLLVPMILHALYNFVVFLAMPQLIDFSTSGKGGSPVETPEP